MSISRSAAIAFTSQAHGATYCERGYQGFSLPMSHFHQNFITIVIDLYGLELDGDRVDTLVASWLQKYDNSWIIKAIVESLYRGRYKIVSVDNILKDWQRLGRPRYNFTPEYEREILQNLPAVVELPAASDSPAQVSAEEPVQADFPVAPRSRQDAKLLDPEESAPFQYHHCPIPAPPLNPPAIDRAASEDPQLQVANITKSIESFSGTEAHPNSSVPSAPAERLDTHGRDPHSEDQIEPDTMVDRPTKSKLFCTLKAIVDPKNRLDANCVSLPSIGVETADRIRIDRFKLPLENLTEQHL
ncbi:hypothetical protein [Chamaesiphon polymorphus]|uniref:DnaD domain-containing protein n=1 Tax=Chamaesiphon polymorphus CCALA 037 TaxID=2107692 RepID=A0A2T1FPJ6_9CYAN|nr:hypothetical protein [Chamaesiphon polymorphus]PSB46895.1 hypothetical protein C7B77_24585 [Chamaesiphon polymorphus CCALA 037]